MYWVLMVVLPVVSFAFFAVIFEQGVARNIPIAVLDEDHTTLSRKVTQMIDDTPTAMVSYEVQSMDGGPAAHARRTYLGHRPHSGVFREEHPQQQPDPYRMFGERHEHHRQRTAVERPANGRHDLLRQACSCNCS